MARARFRVVVTVALWLASALCHSAVLPPLSQPSWSELTAEQKRILAPLAAEWGGMEGFRRKKWLGIAYRYQSMPPDEQARMQRRMTDWAKLSPEERKRARERYKSLEKAPLEEKEAVKQKWQEYKNLPESEKIRLKAAAKNRPSVPAAQSKKPTVSEMPPRPIGSTPKSPTEVASPPK